jgi:hypothetical protein
MGMTDRQFDAYQTRLLREFEKIEEEIKESGAKSKTLETLKKDTEDMLKRP